jgi:hypothetical protein
MLQTSLPIPEPQDIQRPSNEMHAAAIQLRSCAICGYAQAQGLAWCMWPLTLWQCHRCRTICVNDQNISSASTINHNVRLQTPAPAVTATAPTTTGEDHHRYSPNVTVTTKGPVHCMLHRY